MAIYQLAGREPYDMTSVMVKEGRFMPSPGLACTEELSRFGVELSKFMVREFTRHVAPGDVRQLKYDDTNKELALGLLSGIRAFYDAT
ncbi:MAG: hypothetical protein WBJ03_08785 [Moraxellaceae bacterium]